MLTVLARYGLRDRTSRHVLRQVYLQLRRSRPFQGATDDRLDFAEFLSFDAFDTLITRPVFHPADVFLLCAVAMHRRGMIATDASSWRALRYDAERHIAALSHPVEVKLEAIYGHLVTQGALATDQVAEAIAIEREMEHSITRPIAQTIEAVQRFRAAGGAVCVLSDTVLPQADICRLLQRNGMIFGERAVLTSSQAGSTKRSGALFRVGLTRLGASPPVVLHIGENLQSDVRRAKEAGLSTAPFLAGRATRFELCLHENLHDHEGLATVMAGSARAVRLGSSFTDPRKQVVWDTAVGLGGPLLFSFMAWVLREAVRRGLSCLYFPSREGEVLLQVARELQPTLAPDLDCRTLAGSLQSLSLSNMVSWGHAERQWALDGADRLSLGDVVGRLDLPLPVFLQALPADSPLHFIDPDLVLGDNAMALLSPALALSAVQALVLHRAAELRRDWLASFERDGLLAPGPVGIADVGWHGRLQDALCRVLTIGNPGVETRLHGFSVDRDVAADGAGVVSTFDALCEGQPLAGPTWGAVFEMLRTPPGAALGETEAGELAVRQEGIVAFSREAIRILNDADVDPGEHVECLARAVWAVTRLFVETPSRAEAACFGHFRPAGTGQPPRTDPIRFDLPSLWTRLEALARRRSVPHWLLASVARSISQWLSESALRAFGHAPRRHP